MKTIFRIAWIALFALLSGVASVHAQAPLPQERSSYPQPELDRILAPIALYPDSLLSQIMMAATYPFEVVQAARWSRSNPGLRGDDAVRAVDNMDWDPSVKSLVAVPQVLSMMDEKLDWTQSLGEAFLGQEEQVMQTVQELRSRARASGNLATSDQMVVEQQGGDILIESPVPDVVYVPYYDPTVIYGPWWWADYPPVYWGPWSGYDWRPGFAGFGWGLGIAVGGGFFFGAFDWRHHQLRVRDRRPFYFHGRERGPSGNVWRHDPDHRRGVAYRNPALRQQYGGWSAAPDGRREYRGRDRPTTPARVAPPARPATEGFFAPRVDGRANSAARPGTATPGSTPQYRGPSAPQAPPPQAFEGVGRGQETRNSSARGQQSLPSRPAVAPSSPPARQYAPAPRASPPARQSAPAAPSSPPAQQAAPARSSGGTAPSRSPDSRPTRN